MIVLCTLSSAILMIVISQFSCYQVRVSIRNADQLDTSEFEITDSEIPPFEVPLRNSLKFQNAYVSSEKKYSDSTDVNENSSVDKKWNGLSSKLRHGLLGNARIRRSKPDEWCNKTERINRAISVAKDDAVHLSCHGCMDTDDKLYESMQWIKLSPAPDNHGRYLVKEVFSDMHDDEQRNNLVINLEHTLIVRKTRKSDSGSYICKPFTEHQFAKKRMDFTELQTWIAENSHMRYFYHLDVLDFDKIPMVESGGDSGRPKIPPYDMIDENLFIYTKWLPWGSCNICDQIGMRQRIGLCVVKKRDRVLAVPHGYLNNILGFARNGLPCHSEFLKEFERNAWLSRPNEIEFSECFERCPSSSVRKKRSTISVREISEKYEKQTKKKNIINVKVGKHLVLKCPGSKILKKPVWMLGSKVISQVHIRKTTNKRVNFDFLGSIHFMEVKLNDTGIYSCWIEKKLKKKFDVRVRESQFKEVVKYGQKLGVSLAVDFIIFLFLSLIKCFHRRVQVRRKHQPRKPKSQADTER